MSAGNGTEGNRMAEVLALLGRIAAAETVDAVWTEVTAHFAPLGFRRVNYGLTRFRREGSIGDPDDALYLTTNDADYARHYFKGGFYTRTPIYRWLMRNTGVCTFRWVQEAYAAGRLHPEEAAAVEFNARHGIVAGIAISFPEMTNRTKGAFGLTADAGMTHDDVDRIWARDGEGILAIANMMHMRIVALPAAQVRRALTSRQREVLEWSADGKTVADIAVILGVSAAVVEKHLRLAREALNVDTTAQAVAKAVLMNLIFPQPSAPQPSAA
jgi:LuxR family transcriptional regulator